MQRIKNHLEKTEKISTLLNDSPVNFEKTINFSKKIAPKV